MLNFKMSVQVRSKFQEPVKRKDELLKDLFGEENPDIPSPQDRWINIKAVVRVVFKELGYKYGFIDKRWTEIAPKWKLCLSAEIINRLSEFDKPVLENRPDIVERLIKGHVSNRIDWKKERVRKTSQKQTRRVSNLGPVSHINTIAPPSPISPISPISPVRSPNLTQRVPYQPSPKVQMSEPTILLPPLSSLVGCVPRM
ncbi:hypothetical protein AA313_de0204817 [Arthrobotrys entomopaga]|nr:hypothetical protein AA313_de0204817 [Arthrobotrys entomopaga]